MKLFDWFRKPQKLEEIPSFDVDPIGSPVPPVFCKVCDKPISGGMAAFNFPVFNGFGELVAVEVGAACRNRVCDVEAQGRLILLGEKGWHP